MHLNRLMFCASLLLALPVHAGNVPQSGWGFDWLQPERARCIRLSSLTKQQRKVCKAESMANAFKPDAAGSMYRCKLSSSSEFFMFDSKKTCQEQLETMRANAP